jgi:hypothetical protein
VPPQGAYFTNENASDGANDSGAPEDRLAAATVALHKAITGLEAPAQLLVDILKAEPPKE